MGVIGRLDDQVNEVIIKPVGERRKPQDDEGELPPEESAPARQESARDDDIANAQPSELPVWLL